MAARLEAATWQYGITILKCRQLYEYQMNWKIFAEYNKHYHQSCIYLRECLRLFGDDKPTKVL